MNPERPVVLLHADNFVQRGETLKPRVHGRFQALAAAEEHGWDNLLIISPEGQTPRIKRISKKEFGRSVAICTAEEVLTESPKKRILRVIANHRVSRENRWFTWKHRVLGTVEALPGGIPFIDWVSKLLLDKGAIESTVPRWFK